jgi:transcription-repair coupling factor (superfamily II helicase)
MCDRFGDPPKPVIRLIDSALCKALAERAGIRKVEAKDGRITFVSGAPKLDIWSEVFAQFPQLSFVGAGSPLIMYRMRRDDDPTALAVRVLSKYVSVMEDRE